MHSESFVNEVAGLGMFRGKIGLSAIFTVPSAIIENAMREVGQFSIC